jgi:hypothetical protein
MWKWIGVFVGISSYAFAAPKPPQCVPDQTADTTTLVAVNGKAVACWGPTGDCLSLDDAAVVSRPTAVPATEVRDDGGKPSACKAKTCKPLGKKLVAALAKAHTDLDASKQDNPSASVKVTVTTDLAMVAIDGPGGAHSMWNVAGDRELHPKQPAVFPAGDQVGMYAIEAVGKLVFTSWTDCAGPCAQEIAVDADGNNHSRAFEAGATVALDSGGYLVIGQFGTATALDHNGRHSGTAALDGPAVTQAHAVAIGPNEVEVVEPDSGGAVFFHVTVSSGGQPTVGAKTTVAACTP